jgi:hypothetical protein
MNPVANMAAHVAVKTIDEPQKFSTAIHPYFIWQK